MSADDISLKQAQKLLDDLNQELLNALNNPRDRKSYEDYSEPLKIINKVRSEILQRGMSVSSEFEEIKKRALNWDRVGRALWAIGRVKEETTYGHDFTAGTHLVDIKESDPEFFKKLKRKELFSEEDLTLALNAFDDHYFAEAKKLVTKPHGTAGLWSALINWRNDSYASFSNAVMHLNRIQYPRRLQEFDRLNRRAKEELFKIAKACFKRKEYEYGNRAIALVKAGRPVTIRGLDEFERRPAEKATP